LLKEQTMQVPEFLFHVEVVNGLGKTTHFAIIAPTQDQAIFDIEKGCRYQAVAARQVRPATATELAAKRC
jgi:hypothetical protein